MLEFTDKVAILKLLKPQSDKLHAFPCWGHKTTFCDSGESKGKDNFENNFFFSPIYDFSIWKKHQCVVYWKKPFLSIIFFLIYGANFFLPAQARYPKLCSEGRETTGSPKWAIKHLFVTWTEEFSWNESELQQYKPNCCFCSKCPSNARWGTTSLYNLHPPST